MPEALQVTVSRENIGASNVVTESHFGVNLLFDRDSNHNDETGRTVSDNFVRAFEELRATNFRYPGGAVSEVLFDIRDPNNPNQAGDWKDAVSRAFDPDGAGPLEGVRLTLVGALDFARDTGTEMTFVMPTHCFLGNREDDSGHRMANVNVELVQGFVNQLLDESLARGVTIAAIEIGNEWYADFSPISGSRMTPVEYGRVASSLSALVQSAIDQWKADNDLPLDWQEPEIAIQVGQGGDAALFSTDGHFIDDAYSGGTITATELIFREFNTADERASVDALISHRYLAGSITNADGWLYRQFDIFEALADERGGFGQLSRYVTEWNVSNRNAEVLDRWHACAIVTLFAEMIEAGVDSANIWAVQQNNNSRITNNAGFLGEEYAGLSAAGEVFRLMSSSLLGLSFVETTDSLDEIQTHVFASDDRAVAYFSNISTGNASISIDPSQILSGYSYAWAAVVGSAQAQAAEVEVSILTGRFLIDDGGITLNLAPGEVVQLELVSGIGVRINGDVLRDQVVGSFDSDEISVEEGSDWVRSGAGRDTIDGGSGKDRLWGEEDGDDIDGGTGEDRLFGGSGADQLSGGHGDDAVFGGRETDTLYGGIGEDSLYGGDARDVLIGGEGNDQLFGGSGVDVFVMKGGLGRDVICDFEAGVDRIDLSAWGLTPGTSWRASFGQRGSDVWVEGPDGSIVVVKDALHSEVRDAVDWL